MLQEKKVVTTLTLSIRTYNRHRERKSF